MGATIRSLDFARALTAAVVLAVAGAATLAVISAGPLQAQQTSPIAPAQLAPSAPAPQPPATPPPASASPAPVGAPLTPTPPASALPASPVQGQAQPGQIPPTQADPNAALPPPLQPATQLDAGKLEAFVDGLIGGYMRDDKINGVAVAVVNRDGPLLLKGYGADREDGRDVDPNRTLFRIASISKTFTWLSLLQLIEEGKVQLDAPINQYLPAAARVPDQGFSQPVLVRHLFSHNAGFEDAAAGRLFRGDMRGALPFAEEQAFRQPRRVRAPGEAAVYSNFGSNLAGLIVQTVGAQEFQARVETRIFGPLAMQRTSFREPYAADPRQPAPLSEALAKDISEGFSWRGGRAVKRPFEFVTPNAPAGGASTTAADMVRYMRMFLNKGALDGQRIVSPETIALLEGEPLFANAPGLNGLAYGFMQTRSRNGWRAYGHGGNTLWFSSWMAIYPELGVGVFVIANTEGGGRKIQSDAPRAIIDEFFPQAPDFAPAPKPDETAAPALARLAGEYITDRRNLSTVEKAFCLVGCIATVTATPEGQLVIASGSEAARFSPVDVITQGARTFHRFRNVETKELMAFITEANQPTRFASAGGVGRSTRVAWLQSPTTFSIVANLALLAGVLALASGVWRAVRRRREGSETRIAGVLVPLAGAAWAGAIGIMTLGISSIAADSWQVFAGWPPQGVVLGLWGTLIATVLTAAAILFVGLGWRGADWSVWRRIRLVLTLLIFAAAPVVMAQWNLLGPFGL